EFEKVSDIIQYINYWQDQYLDLRRQKRQLKDDEEGFDEERFNQHLKAVREISSQVGEFLRLVRSMGHHYLDQFQQNSYEELFKLLNDATGWESVKSAGIAIPPAAAVEEEATPPLDVSEIPGMNLLPNDEAVPKEEKAEPSEAADVVEHLTESIPESSELELVEAPVPVIADTPEEEAPISELPPEEELEPLPDAAEDIIKEGLDLIRKGKRSKALQHMEGAVTSNPNDTDIRYHYALMLAQQSSSLSQALLQVDRVLEIDPEQEEANFLKGEIAEINEDYATALQYYEKVSDLNEDFPDVFYRMGALRASLEESDPTEAATNLKVAMKKAPDNIDAVYQYGVLLNERLGKSKKAEKYFKKTIQLDEDHPFAFYDLALIYHQNGQYAAAREAYLEAVENNAELRTPENEAAFVVPEATPTPAELPTSAATEAPILELAATPEDAEELEISAITALKENIARLEKLLQQREEEAIAATIEPAAIQEPTPQPAPEPEQPTYPIKTVLITGATSGIGKATADIFAAHGHRLILTGRRIERLEALQQGFEQEHKNEVFLLNYDVRDAAASKAAIESLPEAWQDIDILINNAGKAKGLAPIHEGQLEHWDEMIDTNIKGLLYMTRLIAPGMVARRSGHIINVASTAGKEVYPKGNVYCATKFAVDALTKGMRLDLHPYNIRVSQVSPAHVEETEFALVRFDGDAERAKIYEDFKPLAASDVANSIYYLAMQPSHVNIQDVLLMGTQQASAFMIDRSGRAKFEEE
ncbi:MAG: SDR family NAD(P)-dependent oxidoreductase, partial [Bacteroidota bacterium]